MQEFDKIVDVEIVDEMKRSYIDYAMSVIVARALPDVRDGLKPVHRRIIYAMNELGLDPSKAHKKCARIVGDTMGKYHPHGDAAIYDALVRLAQPFSMRYTLVDGHGNFGNIDGYPAAAQRYTEARLAKTAIPMLADIEKNTVDFVDNYDGEFKEPVVLPSRFPNLLVNGSSGIAVGMATNIPPHNLKEVINGVVKIIDNIVENDSDTDIQELMEIIKGPDFPTGATILGKSGIREAYTTGKGKIRLRSTAEIITEKDKEKIIFTDVPYQVNKAVMIKRIAELVKEKKIEGISDIHDASGRDTGIKIIVTCKKDANANVVLNQLYKYSQLQESYSINFLAIVNGEPKVLNLKQMLMYYLDFQKEVVQRRTRFDLDKALARIHIIQGLLKALDFIDEVISIIRSSKTTADAKQNLIDRFEFTDAQVSAIVEMRLRALTGLEKEKLETEYNELSTLAQKLEAILNDDKTLYKVIKDELTEISNKYGDERKTQIVYDEGEIDIEDLIDDEMSVITISSLNYIKRQPLSVYKSQNRGGKGIIGMQTRDEDYVKDLFLSSNHTELLVFTNKGKVYSLKTYEIPEAGRTAKGTPAVNLVHIESGEKISAVIPIKEREQENFLTMVTRKGVIKRTSVSLFNNIRKMGIIALTINNDDELISVCETNGREDIFIVTKGGMSIRFKETDVRSMGRNAAGVKGIELKDGDEVVSAEIMEEGSKALIVSEKGYGKCTELDEFKCQNRGGKGVRTYKISEKTGNVIDAKIVNENEELMMITSEGVIIRIRVKDISISKRVTQGVKLINVNNNVTVVSVAAVSGDCSEESGEPQENTENE